MIQWEYAKLDGRYLYKDGQTLEGLALTFIGPDGSPRETVNATGYLSTLNELGREGWEVCQIDISRGAAKYALEGSVQRYPMTFPVAISFFLKRPIS